MLSVEMHPFLCKVPHRINYRIPHPQNLIERKHNLERDEQFRGLDTKKKTC